MRDQHRERESFADFVRKVRSVPEAEPAKAQSWPQPIRDGHWIDGNGTHWQIRGGGAQLLSLVVRRLLKRPDLRVLHAYGPHPTEVSGKERDALLDRVARYIAGEAPPHSEFWLAEFRDDNRHVMLVIQESC